LRQLTCGQGDQIGRIFAYWAIVYIGQFFLIAEVAQIVYIGQGFFENCRSSPNFGLLFSAEKEIYL
jgi:hypothetical protein